LESSIYGLSLKKAQYILETSSSTPLLAKKTTRLFLPEMRLSGPSTNRDVQLPVEKQGKLKAKTITDMRRRDYNLPLRKLSYF
jgi:hypothetical protein